jgi:hypothetical protein
MAGVEMGRVPWFVFALVAFACAPGRLEEGVAASVRLDTPGKVGWEPTGPFRIEAKVLNAAGRPLNLVQPESKAAQVKVFRASDGTLACQTSSPTYEAYEGSSLKSLGASKSFELVIDLGPYCSRLTPGLYRYEMVYVANRANSSAPFWSGVVGPQGGDIEIGPGAGPPKPTPVATIDVDTIRVCVDRELTARGLNAYGDADGTVYEDHPPAEEGGRIFYVAARNPEIRAACGIPSL